MISFTVRMDFAESDRSKMEDYLRKLTAATRLEPGNVTYIPHFVKEGPPAILIYEQYRDQAAADAHRGSSHFADYGINGFLKLISNRQRVDLDAIA